MGQTIELESIQRLDIKAGETVVATLPEETTPQDVARAQDALRAALPTGVKVIVTNRDLHLSVLCPSSPA